ncbi:MAG: hypothetical protein MUE83_04190 [Tabrizicola sp.]|nr:hypothetical protein [Tabrizicola sp.]
MAEKQVSVRLKAEGAGQLRAEFQSIGTEAQRSFGALDRGARSSGQGLQNVGFQVQDFAVQVAGGTDASRALAQQLPQLLSGFGLLGVVLGTTAAVAVPLFAAFGLGSDEEEPPGNTPPEARYPMSMPVRPAAAPLLVAIVGPPWRAVLRTGGGDQTVVVELGDTVGAYHVRGIARTGVSLRSGDSSLRLTLEPSR